MSQAPSTNACFFDFEGDQNDHLRGGTLGLLKPNIFLYEYRDKDGKIFKVLITLPFHGGDMIELLTGHPAEMAEALRMMKKAFGNRPHTVYINQGKEAGETIGFNTKLPDDPTPEGDHTHVIGLIRNPNDAAAGMGVELLINKYNAAVVRVTELERERSRKENERWDAFDSRT